MLDKNPIQTRFKDVLARGFGVDERRELGDRLAEQLGRDPALRLADALYEIAWALEGTLESQAPLVPHSDDVVEERTHNAVTYRRAYQTCGKPNCKCARGGELHGPYWKAYTRDRGRLRCHYIGKKFRELD